MFRAKAVLEEDAYVKGLETIIERDFYPEIKELRATVHSDDKSQTNGGEFGGIAQEEDTLRSNYSRFSSWESSTPKFASHIESGANSQDEKLEEVEGMSLDAFAATHTSEDNEAFTELQIKAVEEHRARYHWAFDPEANKKSKLYLLKDGTWMSDAQKKSILDACAPSGDDTRPKVPETWRYHAQNPLLFPPQLEINRDICQVQTTKNGRLLLKQDSSDQKQSAVKKKIVHANCRFSNNVEATTTTVSSDDTGYDLVQMTPVVAPGIDASPFMTWGSIEGTPLVLDSDRKSDAELYAPAFEVKGISNRERLAGIMGNRAKRSITPMRRNLLRTPLTNTPQRSRKLDKLCQTPQQNLRRRISSLRTSIARDNFGMDSELRATYSTPQLPPRSKKLRK